MVEAEAVEAVEAVEAAGVAMPEAPAGEAQPKPSTEPARASSVRAPALRGRRCLQQGAHSARASLATGEHTQNGPSHAILWWQG